MPTTPIQYDIKKYLIDLNMLTQQPSENDIRTITQRAYPDWDERTLIDKARLFPSKESSISQIYAWFAPNPTTPKSMYHNLSSLFNSILNKSLSTEEKTNFSLLGKRITHSPDFFLLPEKQRCTFLIAIETLSGRDSKLRIMLIKCQEAIRSLIFWLYNLKEENRDPILHTLQTDLLTTPNQQIDMNIIQKKLRNFKVLLGKRPLSFIYPKEHLEKLKKLVNSALSSISSLKTEERYIRKLDKLKSSKVKTLQKMYVNMAKTPLNKKTCSDQFLELNTTEALWLSKYSISKKSKEGYSTVKPLIEKVISLFSTSITLKSDQKTEALQQMVLQSCPANQKDLRQQISDILYSESAVQSI